MAWYDNPIHEINERLCFSVISRLIGASYDAWHN
jgi:hypothetical protein